MGTGLLTGAFLRHARDGTATTRLTPCVYFPQPPAVPFPIGSPSTAGAYLIYVMGGFLGCKARINKGCFEEGFWNKRKGRVFAKGGGGGEEEEGERGGIDKEGGSEEETNKKKAGFFLFKGGVQKEGKRFQKKEGDVFSNNKEEEGEFTKKKGFQKEEELSKGGG